MSTARRMVVLNGKFTPRSISGLAFWHDPSNDGTVTLNGGDVSQINDLSTFSRNNSQATEAEQPAYTTGASGINNRNVISFTAANNDALSMANALGVARNVTGFTFVGVARIAALGSGHRILTIFNNATGVRFSAGVNTSNQLNIGTRRLDGEGADTKASTATITAGQAFFFTYAVDYVNGSTFLQLDAVTRTQAITGWTVDGGNSSDTNSGAAPLFGRQSTNTLNADVAVKAGYARFLSPSEIERLRTQYFKPKWGTP